MKLLYNTYINGTSISRAWSKKHSPWCRGCRAKVLFGSGCNSCASAVIDHLTWRNTHTIHATGICLPTCWLMFMANFEEIYHTWILWDMYINQNMLPKLSPLYFCVLTVAFFGYIYIYIHIYYIYIHVHIQLDHTCSHAAIPGYPFVCQPILGEAAETVDGWKKSRAQPLPPFGWWYKTLVNNGIPSWELTYPHPRYVWRWFSFSQGGIC